jgi:hypothetical protein
MDSTHTPAEQLQPFLRVATPPVALAAAEEPAEERGAASPGFIGTMVLLAALGAFAYGMFGPYAAVVGLVGISAFLGFLGIQVQSQGAHLNGFRVAQAAAAEREQNECKPLVGACDVMRADEEALLAPAAPAAPAATGER